MPNRFKPEQSELPTDRNQTINLQTAKIAWQELQLFFAKGDVIWVDASLDLIDVAQKFSEDDHVGIKSLLTSQKMCKMPDELARQWTESNKEVWAVVIVPWILVQDRGT